MTGYNMPDGCEEHMIPGNDETSVAWEQFIGEGQMDELYEEYYGYECIDDAGSDEAYESDASFRAYVDTAFDGKCGHDTY